MDAYKISLQKIGLIWDNKTIKTILVFLSFLLIFLLFHLGLNPDHLNSPDDPYYHAEHSRQMAESGDYALVKPWLKFHFLSSAPTDPWWGAHVLQALFIKLADSVLIGTKIYIACLDAAILAVLYFILKELSIGRPLVWTFFYFASSWLFLGRILYERPFLWAIIVIPLSLIFVIRKKYPALFVLSFFYALIYNLSSFILFIPLVAVILDYIDKKKIDFKMILSPLAGFAAGVLAHPESLNYLKVMGIHIVKVLYYRFAGVNLGIGEEVCLQGDFLTGNLFPIALYVIAIAIYIAFKEIRKKQEINILFYASLAWFLMNFAVPRAIEYWLPLAVIFSALIIKEFQEIPAYGFFIKNLHKITKVNIIRFFLISALSIVFAHNILKAAGGLIDNNDDKIISSVASLNHWLVDNTPEASAVFYDNWSAWPAMFYHNKGHNVFLLGMDPTFTYEDDPKIFWIWRNLSLYGLYCDRQDLCPEISAKENLKLTKEAFRNILGTEYIMVEDSKENSLFNLLDSDDGNYDKIYEDGVLALFFVIPALEPESMGQ